MQKLNSMIRYSATDVVNFLDCEHLTTLDLIHLETPLPQAADAEETQLYARKGLAHEAAWLAQLRGRGLQVCEIVMAIRCTTPEQMALVNTLCWARDYAGNVSACDD
jgi:hypothetical protein